MKHIYFFKKDVVDSQPYVDDELYEKKDTIDVHVYDLSRYNENIDDLDYMKVEEASVYNEEDSPAAPYLGYLNDFYVNHKDEFVDYDLDHSLRQMAKIYRDLCKTLGAENVTKDDVYKALHKVEEKKTDRPIYYGVFNIEKGEKQSIINKIQIDVYNIKDHIDGEEPKPCYQNATYIHAGVFPFDFYADNKDDFINISVNNHIYYSQDPDIDYNEAVEAYQELTLDYGENPKDINANDLKEYLTKSRNKTKS